MRLFFLDKGNDEFFMNLISQRRIQEEGQEGWIHGQKKDARQLDSHSRMEGGEEGEEEERDEEDGEEEGEEEEERENERAGKGKSRRSASDRGLVKDARNEAWNKSPMGPSPTNQRSFPSLLSPSSTAFSSSSLSTSSSSSPTASSTSWLTSPSTVSATSFRRQNAGHRRTNREFWLVSFILQFS